MNFFGELVQDLALVGWTATLVGFSCVLSAPQDRFPGVGFFCHFVFELVSIHPIRFLSSFFLHPQRLHTTTDLFLPHPTRHAPVPTHPFPRMLVTVLIMS